MVGETQNVDYPPAVVVQTGHLSPTLHCYGVHETSCWVSTGDNLPYMAEQVKRGMVGTTIGMLAAQAGISEEQISTHLSTILPYVVGKLTATPQSLKLMSCLREWICAKDC